MAALKNLAVPVLTIGAIALGAGPAGADAPEPFTITESIDFEAGEFSFTATGGLCPSGTFEDTPKTFAAGDSSAGKVVILIRTVYTCDDGSGTFNALKHVVITFTGDDSSTSSGPISLKGGTGDYAGLSGHGVDVGEAEDGLGVGNISGVLVR
ncbi:hypothetical protein [Arthrobacter nitrophenolicus]|jgi:hypothetical protein|uniref:Lipoprotein n=1 Tax=Arthrobacter nitrophenolicus TaxID=683150 RepID=A0A4R5Y350_9MICC|nr:hypothetical protein [Arthrobacter nitrophenolicus]TDL38900.1 hypothetical protein E2R57_08200 [Arthrobacter nitrophenolicus]